MTAVNHVTSDYCTTLLNKYSGFRSRVLRPTRRGFRTRYTEQPVRGNLKRIRPTEMIDKKTKRLRITAGYRKFPLYTRIL